MANNADIELSLGITKKSYGDILKDIESIQKRLTASGVKLKVDLDIGKLDQKMADIGKYKSLKNIGNTISKSLIDQFGIVDKNVQAKVRELSGKLADIQIDELKIKESGGSLKDDRLSHAIVELGNVIVNNSNIIKERTGIYDEFYNTLKKMGSIKISDTIIKDLGDDWNTLKMTVPNKFSVSGGIEMDSIYQELSSQFQGIFSGTANPTEQFRELIAAIQNYRADVRQIEPLDADTLGLRDSVFESILTELGKMDAMYKSVAKSAQDMMGTSNRQTGTIEGLEYKLDTEKYATDIKTLTNQLNRYGNLSSEVFEQARLSLNDLSSAYDRMADKTLDDSARLNAEEEYQKALQKTRNLMTQLNSAKDNDIAKTGDIRRVNTINTLNKYLADNTALSRQNRQTVKEWIKTLASSDDMTVGAIKNIQTEFKSLDTTLKNTGETGLSTTDRLKQIWDKISGWSLMAAGIAAVTDKIRKIPEEVYEIDSAMVGLQKVTDETDNKYKEFLDSAGSSAQELGRSVSDLVEQTAQWAKLGYNIDDASELAMTSSIYANVGEVDDEKAVSNLITTMKAFNIEAENSISIVDELNKLGNEFSVSSSDLGDGLSKSASAMALGGSSMEKTLALLTGASEITQSASEMGDALQIGQMRILNMKEALEELGEGYEDLESVSKMQTHILNLTEGQVNIRNNADPAKLKDYYDILESVAKVYDSLDQTKQADLLETLFGKQRGNQGAALIQAFQSGQVQKALEAASHAEGSAMEEQEKWLQSLETKTQQFEAAFQSLANTVLDSGLLKDIVDFGTFGVNAIEELAKGVNYLNSVFGLLDSSMGGTLGMISGFLMNKAGIGERTMFQW